MSTPTIDSNLLLGVIAVRMDFITSDELNDAVQVWKSNTSKPFGDVLVENKKLTPDRRSLLEALVQEHLEQHGNDPGVSFAALCSAAFADTLPDLSGDFDLQTKPAEPVAGPNEDPYATRQSESLAERQTTSSVTAESGPRYRSLRPHAKGGMGQVCVALDKELHREVALKELQMRFSADNRARERFLIEAEITGNLEHPGIVPVYGLGHYSDGRPYYAMRFVEGDDLKGVIEQFHHDGEAQNPGRRRIELRKLLGRFVDVCHAIQYAHSRGVLHRDLKPGNIMLGKFGETLVVDWGLAKSMDDTDELNESGAGRLQPVSGSESAATRMGSVLGTPAYMSPEQAAGRLDLLSPASDVYGLGATLYHLIVGQQPFRDAKDDLLKKVKEGDFRRPREVNQKISPALEAVCLKAMARNPDDRYESAFQLAEDIEHWMADEPVSAWREPLLTRLGRWTRRHRSLVGSGVMASCLVLVVLTVSLLLVSAAYKKEQRSFEQARRTVDEYFTLISEDALLNQPGTQTLRRDLLQRALVHYERFVRERGDDPSLQNELADAQFRVGMIKEAIDSPDEALAVFRQAAHLQRQLIDQRPRDPQRLYALGRSLTEAGRVLQKQGRKKESLKAFEEAIEVRARLVELAPNDAEYARTLANSYMNIGTSKRADGLYAEARDHFEKAQALRTAALKLDPNNRKLRRDLGQGDYNLANLSAEEAKVEDAKKHFADAVKQFELLLAEDYRDFQVREQLAIAYRRLGDLDESADAALEFYQLGKKAVEPLAQQNPDVRQYQESHAWILMNLAASKEQRDEVEEAIALYEEARDLFQALAEDAPPDSPYRADYAAASMRLGQLFLLLESPAEAGPLLADALQATEELVSQENNERHRWIHAVTLYHSGRFHWAENRAERAAQDLEASRKAVIELADEFPDDARYAQRATAVLVELYSLYRWITETTDLEPAVGADRVAPTLKALLQHSPDYDYGRDSARGLQEMALLQWAGDRLKVALGTLELSCASWEQRLVAQPMDADVEESCALALGDLAALFIDHGERLRDDQRLEESLTSLQRASEILTSLTEEYPDDVYYHRNLAEAQWLIRRVQDELKRHDRDNR